MTDVDVIVLGAGAAGLLCAAEAGFRGRRVLVVDHAAAAGEKIRISGGGRCNFTNLHAAPDRFLSRNPRFAISALARFTPGDFVARVDAAGIAWHEKTLGQLFCDGPSTQIVAMLLADLRRAGGRLWLSTAIGAVARAGRGFRVETSRGPVLAASVVVATGGRSIPKMGATGFGTDLAQAFGLPVVPQAPGLVPLTFADQDRAWLQPLSGIAVEGRAAARGTAFDESLLFTHRGLSGPAILQVSSYWRPGDPLVLDLARGRDAGTVLRDLRARSGRMGVPAALAQVLPERLARAVAGLAGVGGTLAQQANATLDRLAAQVHGWTLKPVGTEGYRTAEVTLGGVSTEALDARTMEARTMPGLFFVGEVVDVTGWLGGYNFQWAWASGWAAGQAA